MFGDKKVGTGQSLSRQGIGLVGVLDAEKVGRRSDGKI